MKHFFLILFLFFICISFKLKTLNKKPLIKLDKQDSALNINSTFLNLVSFGQRRLISNILWITTLLESDQKHYKGKDQNSWMFLRFKSISDLDPLFLKNYQFGGQYLSIIKDDLLGSKWIFEKGLIHYPFDYSLNLNYGFLLAFELRDYKLAVKPYEKILKMPNPPEFLYSLIPKLKFMTSNNKKDTFDALYETYKNLTEDSFLKTKIHNDLYSLKAHIDLNCLNKKEKNCSYYDFDMNRYKKDLKTNLYFAIKEFKEYKIYEN